MNDIYGNNNEYEKKQNIGPIGWYDYWCLVTKHFNPYEQNYLLEVEN